MGSVAENGTLIDVQGQTDLNTTLLGGYRLSPDSIEYRVRLPEGDVFLTLSREDPIVVQALQAQEDVRSMKAALNRLEKGTTEYDQLEVELRSRKEGVCLPQLFEELTAIQGRILESIEKGAEEYFQDPHLAARRMAVTHPEITGQDRQVVIDEVLSNLDRAKMRIGFGIRLATEEIFKNHAMHGNNGEFDKSVAVEYGFVTPDRFLIISEDQGEGFELGQVADCLADENLGRTSGRGIMLANSFLDSVEYTQEYQGRRVVCEINFLSRLDALITDAIEKLPAKA